MALVPSKLLGNWAKEWNRFIDVNDTLLNFKLLIGHSQAKNDDALTGHVGDGLATAPNSTPAQAASRFLVLTTPGSYKSNVAKALKRTFHSSYVPLGRKRAVQRLESEQRDVWGQVYRDEYHEEKGVGTVGMDVCRNARTKNNGCQVWFVSGTPWAKSPRDLQGVLEVLSGPSWEHHPCLKAATGEQYRRLISSYEALLNRTEAIPLLLTKNNPISTMAEILETIMIRRTGDSSWFNGPIINLPRHTRSIIEVAFPDSFRPFLTEMENKVKQLLNKEGSRHEFERFFEKAYKIRAAAAIPGLSRLIHDDPSLDLTWTQFCRNGWLEKPDNPYLQNIQRLIWSSPKYSRIKEIINGLKTMTFRPPQDDESTTAGVELEIVKEKLVIVATNPLVCYVFSKVCLYL